MIVFVPIAESHIASFRECLDAVARERQYLAMTQAPPIDQVTAFIRDNIRNKVPQYVALDGQRVVGWADVARAWPDATAHCARLGMGVLAPYRGRGIGRRLLEACLESAWASGVTRVELEVRADNAPAIALYRQAGFQTECLKKRALRFDGVYFDALQMIRLQDV